MDQNDIALALDAIAQKWEDRRATAWRHKEQFDVDRNEAARTGNRSEETRYAMNSHKYETLASYAKEASNDAHELAARVRGLTRQEATR